MEKVVKIEECQFCGADNVDGYHTEYRRHDDITDIRRHVNNMMNIMEKRIIEACRR